MNSSSESKEYVELNEDLSASELYSKDLAPTKKEDRTWSKWHLAALWVGMAVCIPTYLLASYMIVDGMTWVEALIIIGLANLIITIPMVLNGHAGVKYGVPFPVIGRSSFGIRGIHLPAIVRAIVACGWFGIQTWIGGLAFYAIYMALIGGSPEAGLSIGKFIGFGIFWLMNMYFIVKGTESIKFLEQYSAPILILIGLILIGWGAKNGGGLSSVLKQSSQLTNKTAVYYQEGERIFLTLNPLKDKNGDIKAKEYVISLPHNEGTWEKINSTSADITDLSPDPESLKIRLRNDNFTSSEFSPTPIQDKKNISQRIWSYILWLTIMLGFWATMSLSIADITRYASTQKDQVLGQFIGLPGTMMLYSFVGIFVTCAAVLIFDDILITNDVPWDPVTLLSKFQNPVVVIIAQIFMIIATLSTNIAANVIAPANAFSNVWPKKIDFVKGGLITGIIGIIICPWYLLNEISGLLIFVSGLLGPVLGIMLCDYFIIRKKNINLAGLYKVQGPYSYFNGFNMKAFIALIGGVLFSLVGYFIPDLSTLYKLSWFSGFFFSFFMYLWLMRSKKEM